MATSITLDTLTYAVVSNNNGITTWRETSGGVPTSFSPLTARVQAPTKEGGVYRTEWKLKVPVVAATDTACVCAGGVLRFTDITLTVLLPSNSTTAERTHISTCLQNLTANAANFQPSIISLTQP